MKKIIKKILKENNFYKDSNLISDKILSKVNSTIINKLENN